MIQPGAADMEGFEIFLKNYKSGLAVEKMVAKCLNNKNRG
jgi:predicted RNA-binding protein with TRAM domain